MHRHVLLSLALLAPLALVPHASASSITVTLDVDVFDSQYKECQVSVPAGSDAGDVLDAAVAQGCILLWTYDTYPGFGRYVTCIDAICGAVATFWAFYTNGGFSDLGIDAYPVQHGDVLRFNYEQWVL